MGTFIHHRVNFNIDSLQVKLLKCVKSKIQKIYLIVIVCTCVGVWVIFQLITKIFENQEYYKMHCLMSILLIDNNPYYSRFMCNNLLIYTVIIVSSKFQ